LPVRLSQPKSHFSATRADEVIDMVMSGEDGLEVAHPRGIEPPLLTSVDQQGIAGCAIHPPDFGEGPRGGHGRLDSVASDQTGTGSRGI
jgi:hypothetical protein